MRIGSTGNLASILFAAAGVAVGVPMGMATENSAIIIGGLLS